VLEAIDAAEALLVCPSNPVVSIGTIRAIPAIEARLRARRAAVAVSPLIGGAPVKGPADRLLRGIGVEVSCAGVARLYAPIARGMVIDRADKALEREVAAAGLRVKVEDTLMRDSKVAAQLAASALELAGYRA
jgi:LPPG:FO 2-phospho-L-lactate transferase